MFVQVGIYFASDCQIYLICEKVYDVEFRNLEAS
jgi:hypothetical protein